MEKKLKIDEEIAEKNKESDLNAIKNNYENLKLKYINELKQIDTDITKLNEEKKNLKEKFEKEINLKKKEELCRITNEYKLKLIKYKNEKEIEIKKKKKIY